MANWVFALLAVSAAVLSAQVKAPQLELVAELSATVDPPVDVGPTPRGQHRIIPITGGTFSGPKLKGKILPGGADWQFIHDDGLTEIEARYTLETSDGVRIPVLSKGVRHGPKEVLARLAAGQNVDPSEYYFRTSMSFQPPKGAYEWMERSVFVAVGERYKDRVLIRVWRLP